MPFKWLPSIIIACAGISVFAENYIAQVIIHVAIALTLLVLTATIIFFAYKGVQQARFLSITFAALGIPTAIWVAGEYRIATNIIEKDHGARLQPIFNAA